MDEKNNNLFYFLCWYIIILKILFYSIYKYNSYGYEIKKIIFIVSSKYSIRKIFYILILNWEKKIFILFFMGFVFFFLLVRGRIFLVEIFLMFVNRFDMFLL